MKGDISDSKSGWKDPEDGKLAAEWSKPPALTNSNIALGYNFSPFETDQ